jgi:hypothetical protein
MRQFLHSIARKKMKYMILKETSLKLRWDESEIVLTDKTLAVVFSNKEKTLLKTSRQRNMVCKMKLDWSFNFKEQLRIPENLFYIQDLWITYAWDEIHALVLIRHGNFDKFFNFCTFFFPHLNNVDNGIKLSGLFWASNRAPGT